MALTITVLRGRAGMEGAAFWTIAVIASALVGMSKGGLPVVAML